MEKWGHLTYTGQQSIDKRNKTLQEFASQPNTRILLASLKTGGTGLNLTCASRVILIDLWWNSSVEQQAFARTYRRGQDKETRMMRLIAADSVDTDMVSMQRRKEAEIDAVLSNPGVRRNLTMKELMSLFGKVGEDEEGREFIIVDKEFGGGRGRRVDRFGEEDDDDAGERRRR